MVKSLAFIEWNSDLRSKRKLYNFQGNSWGRREFWLMLTKYQIQVCSHYSFSKNYFNFLKKHRVRWQCHSLTIYLYGSCFSIRVHLIAGSVVVHWILDCAGAPVLTQPLCALEFERGKCELLYDFLCWFPSEIKGLTTTPK